MDLLDLRVLMQLNRGTRFEPWVAIDLSDKNICATCFHNGEIVPIQLEPQNSILPAVAFLTDGNYEPVIGTAAKG